MFCVHFIVGKIQSARSETDMSKVGLGTTPRTRTGTTGTVASARALYNGLSRGASAKPTVTPRGVSMECFSLNKPCSFILSSLVICCCRMFVVNFKINFQLHWCCCLVIGTSGRLCFYCKSQPGNADPSW